ncbi:septum formation inhibitor Maf [Aliidiomarina taiwanensis]|uniref:dTTP/UTP pyrophosphatase n=1 Tax=Aliidiomarina taiwanensis TaxID=946228 RepID=A0A432X7M7_9GAMM|nr:Maf family protein [Aliidiomarina taiwanensis]RUO42842.1 septum formation inhibitor Maf [Aliidiomarina taiwanensis]
MSRLILASASPRRKELLASLYADFEACPVGIEERALPAEKPGDYVQRLAYEKATAGVERFAADNGQVWVLGSDTIVVSGEAILEKPQHKADFERMMGRLSGATHQVMTAVCLRNTERVLNACVVTEVNFRPLSQSDITAYWQTGEPADKAGGYGIQGLAARFVRSISGSYTSVVGLPLCETEALLNQAGFRTSM